MGRKRGSVEPRGDSIRIAFQYQGRKCRETLRIKPTKRNLEHARRKLDVIHYEIEMGTFDYAKHFPESRRARAFKPGWSRTVKEQLEIWLDGIRPQLEYSTWDDYRKIVYFHLIPEFGEKALTELTTSEIRAWIAGLDCSAKRVNNILIPLRGMLADAFEDELIERDPMARIKNLKPVRDEPEPFTPDEVTAILNASEEGQIRNYWQFAFSTGLQTGEQIALAWEDVDWRRGVIAVRRAVVRGREKATLKTASRKREVKLLPMALEALKRQKQHTYLGGGRIFRNPRDGEPWRTPEQLTRIAWRPVLKRAGVRYRNPYQTRHTYASTLLTAGEDPMWVARQMGHADWGQIRKVYGRWIDDVRPEAGEKAARIMGGKWGRNGAEWRATQSTSDQHIGARRVPDPLDIGVGWRPQRDSNPVDTEGNQ